MLKKEKGQTIGGRELNNIEDDTYQDEDCPTDIFFVEVLAVPPPNARPCQFTGGALTIHPQSTSLQNLSKQLQF